MNCVRIRSKRNISSAGRSAVLVLGRVPASYVARSTATPCAGRPRTSLPVYGYAEVNGVCRHVYVNGTGTSMTLSSCLFRIMSQ